MTNSAASEGVKQDSDTEHSWGFSTSLSQKLEGASLLQAPLGKQGFLDQLLLPPSQRGDCWIHELRALTFAKLCFA